MYRFKIVTAIAALLLFGSAAHASTMTDKWLATSAVGSGSDHSLWISTGLGGGIGSDFDFSPAGTLSLFSDGTGILTGRVISQDNAGAGFDLDFAYDNSFDTFTSGPTFKSENGSVATASTIYRDFEGGTLTGFGVLAGLVLEVIRMPATGPYAVQIGEGTASNNGANNKNKNLGMAHWMSIIVKSATCSICGSTQIQGLNGKQGDINVDLRAVPLDVIPVPLPAAFPLLAAGLGAAGLLGWRRRRRAGAAA